YYSKRQRNLAILAQKNEPEPIALQIAPAEESIPKEPKEESSLREIALFAFMDFLLMILLLAVVRMFLVKR
ncbi:MAG: hypothetical protein ACE5DM_00860, partial [Candidatus Nanoarchaeia archaeon]